MSSIKHILFLILLACATIAHAQDDIIVVDSLLTDSIEADSIEVDTLSALTTQQRLERLLDNELFRTTQVAVMAYDLTADTLVFAHNERQTMRPASTMKLLTAITALDHLGESYRYTTSLMLKGQIFEAADSTEQKPKRKKEALTNVLVGNIIVRGGMDPRFNADDMAAFVEAIEKAGIGTVYGSLQADRSFKDQDMLGEGWCWDDKNPVLTPLLWNREDGFMPKFQQRLRDAGIVFRPQTEMPADSLDAPLYAVTTQVTDTLCSRYHSIDQILMRMMKESDNLYAESLFYQIASSATKKAATASDGISVMKSLIKKIGLRPDDYRIADGSGLSLYNYQSAELLTMLLRYAYQNSNIYSHLHPSLPVAGVDGTLKSRMRRTPAAGNVHAKTGTVTGVSSLAGYLTAANGNVIAFAIINQGGLSSTAAKKFQDNVCTALCR